MAAFRFFCAPSLAAVRWCCCSPTTIADHVARLRQHGVTHISGTPSHWRKLLTSGSASGFSPRYVRLSGEIADQAVLHGLSRAFPEASIGHAYASTEAGSALLSTTAARDFQPT
jgi:acyl-coenzyme A synthetase/AMP-(fatty) acid ligase